MNYIELHIGDYSAATFHLSPLEDGIYWRLLRVYYRDECQLPEDPAQVERLAGARTAEEKAAVHTILREFFDLQPDGWHQGRCDAELDRYAEKRDKARASAAASWASRRQNAQRSHSDGNANAMRTHSERTATAVDSQSECNAPQSPDPNHQTPVKKEGTRKRAPGFEPSTIELPDWMDRQAWEGWCSDRKARGKPITAKAAELQIRQLGAYLQAGHLPEAVIAHSIAGGFQGLYPPKPIAQAAAAGKPAESFRERDERLARERVAEFLGTAAPRHQDANTIEAEPAVPRIEP